MASVYFGDEGIFEEENQITENKNNTTQIYEQIEQINLVTNGTVLGSRILKILRDLSFLSKFPRYLSPKFSLI